MLDVAVRLTTNRSLPNDSCTMEVRLGRQLAVTSKYLREDFERALADHGASLPSWVLLSVLAEEDGISQRELATRVHLEGPTIVRHVDRLAEDGYVVRRRDAEDRRITRIELTPAGRRRHRELVVVVDALERQLRSCLSEREQTTLLKLLDRIFDHITSGGTADSTASADATATNGSPHRSRGHHDDDASRNGRSRTTAARRR